MATWFPISGAVVQRILADGTPANGYVLKLYAAGTSINIPLATDSTGATQANYAVYNSLGDITVSGNAIIPHINQNYKLTIYPTQAAADADSGAVLTIDYIQPSSNSGAFTTDDAVDDAVTNLLTLTHTTSGTPAAGIGSGIEFVTETLAGNEIGMSIASVATDVSSGSEDFTFRVKLMAAGAAAATVFDITSTGIVKPYNDIQFAYANPIILGMDTDGALSIGSSTAINLGGNAIFYGDTHATKAKDIELRTDGTIVFSYDASASKLLLGKPLSANSQQIQWSKGTDVASATALSLLTDGNYFDVTGTTTITSFNTTAVGNVVKLHFDDALTLTHNATDLILPGGANITTAAGDEAEFVEYAAGDYRCTNYTKASGEAVVSPAVEYVRIVDPTAPAAAATIDFLTLFSTYSQYNNFRIIGNGLLPGTDNVNFAMLLANSGTADTGAKYRKLSATGTGTFTGNEFDLIGSISNAGVGLNFDLTITNAQSATKLKMLTGFVGCQNTTSDTYAGVIVNGGYKGGAASGGRFTLTSGNWTTNGTYEVWAW